MIKRLQKGVMIYCDHCEAHLGPFEHLSKISDDAICTMLTDSHWRTGSGPSVGVAPKQVQYCTDCKPLPKCKMCAITNKRTIAGEPFCSDHCYKEWRFAHD